MRLLILVLAIGSFCVRGQNLSGVINQYIEVTAVDVNRHAVDVVSSSGIAVDDSLLLFQMQGAEISTSQVDSSNGAEKNYNGTGSWELVEICAVDGNTITFKKQFDQEFSDDGILQLIPINYYSNDVITDTVKCQAWNGTTGGIVVIFNHGTLDFQSSIQVSKLGFRGGQHVESTFSCSFALNLEDYEYDSNTGRAAQKGEGIAFFFGNLDGGRGPLGNGGGGATTIIQVVAVAVTLQAEALVVKMMILAYLVVRATSLICQADLSAAIMNACLWTGALERVTRTAHGLRMVEMEQVL